MKIKRRVIWTLYAYTACRTCFFFIPILFPFYASHGIEKTYWFALMGFSQLLAAGLEIPLGRFADKYGTKLTLVLASAVSSIAVFTFLVFDSVLGMLVPHFFLGITFAADSGTQEAYIHNITGAKEYKDVYKRIARFGMAGMIAVISGSIIASYWSLTLPFKLSGCFSVAAFFLALTLPRAVKETKSHKQKGIIKNVWPLFMFVAIGVLVSYYTQGFFDLESVRVDVIALSQFLLNSWWIPNAEVNTEIMLYGPMIALVSSGYFFRGYFADWFEARPILIVIILSTSLILVGLFPYIWAIVFFGTITMVQGVINFIINARLMDKTADKATIISMKSLVTKLCTGALFLIFALGVKYLSLQYSFMLLGGFVVGWTFFFKKKFNEIRK